MNYLVLKIPQKCRTKGKILLANLAQRSRTAFSDVSFSSFLPPKQACGIHKFRHFCIRQQYRVSFASNFSARKIKPLHVADTRRKTEGMKYGYARVSTDD
jgi:hypothetical protein